MDLTVIFLIFLVLIIAAISVVIFLMLRKKPEPKKDDNSLIMLQNQLNHISQVLDSKLSESNKNAQFQFNQSAKIIGDIRERLTKLDETNKQVVSFADQLQNLQDILKNPKQRGVLGEYMLETVLKNVLPPGSYQIQYQFNNGEKVDAVVFFDKKVIPIDAKFSLENYNRLSESREPLEKKRYEMLFTNDLKNRIEETAKYVRPEEKTMEFAFMFIPHEAVYYDLLVNKVGAAAGENDNLISYAYKKKVIIVSPTSFVAYLQTVIQGLKNQKLSEEAHLIRDRVEKLGKHLFIYSEYMNKMGQHLGTTVSSYNKAGRELEKIDKDVVKLTEGKAKIRVKEIEGPVIDE